jgi:hypothetical protein
MTDLSPLAQQALESNLDAVVAIDILAVCHGINSNTLAAIFLSGPVDVALCERQPFTGRAL